MTNADFSIAGKPAKAPENWKELSVNAIFDDEEVQPSIEITTMVFALKEAKAINQYVDAGRANGVGIFEGLPFSMTLNDSINKFNVFDGMIDLTEDAIFECDTVSVKIKKTNGTNWLNDVADSFSFASLFDEGVVKTSDFVDVPYVVNYIPDGTQVILTSISIYVLTKELIESLRRLADIAAEVIGDTAGSPLGGVGAAIMVALKIIAQLAYTIAMIIAIKQMITQLIENIISPVRIHKGMTFKRMMERGCEKLGLQFRSSIFDREPFSNYVYIPQKDNRGSIQFGASAFFGINSLAAKAKGETGFPSNNSAMYTFGDFIRVLKDMFNAKVTIIGNELFLEERNFFKNESSFIIPPTEITTTQYNTDEIISNYLIQFQFDNLDCNTLDNFGGTNVQAVTKPIRINDKGKVLIKNLREISLPLALGTRKSELTKVENVIRSLARFTDKIVNALGGNSTFEKQIKNRIGMMSLSSDFIGIPKVVILKNGKLPTNYRSELSARFLYDNFHASNSFVPAIVHNQWRVFKGVEIKFCFSDFLQVIDNNFCKTADGKEARIDSLNWSFAKQTAIIDFRVKEIYTNNLKIEINEP